MADNKTKPTQVSASAFIDAIADPVQRADSKTLVKMLQRLTGEKPKMWGPSIVGFGSYHYTYETGREGDAPIAAFSPRKAATVLYGLTKVDGGEELLAGLGRCKISGSCLHIKKLADVDAKLLEALVSKSVEAIRARYPG
jgi:hypothetical protein